LAVLALAASGCVDYVYRHHVTGTVVDAQSKPIAGATVRRVLASGEQFGVEPLYVRRTDDQGRFEFLHSGLGPKPEPSHTWILVVEHPGFEKARTRFEAGWIDPSPSGKIVEHGYVKLGVVIELSPVRP
jgi:hypothetical protein